MKALTLFFIFYSALAFGQDTILVGKRIIITEDKSIAGYKLRKVGGSNRDTLKVSEAMMKNIKSKLTDEQTITKLRRPVGFQLIVDQDAFISKFNEDRDYTMGLQAAWTWKRYKDRFVRKLFGINDTLPVSKNHYVTFSFSGFTPYHLEYNYIDRTDRPYAALASLTKSSTYNFKRRKFLFTGLTREHFFRSAVMVGFMGRGTSQTAKFIQTAIHSGQRAVADDPNDARPNPLGWEYAIASKASFPVVANYFADYANELELLVWTPKSTFSPLKLLVKPSAGIAIGNLYDYGTVGGQFQFGFFSSNSWSGSRDGAIFDIIGNPKLFELSFTGEYFLQYWLHNSTLNGILFNRNSDVYHLNYNQIERWTNYYGFGAEISYKRKITLGYSKYVRSAVMKGLDRKQIFGRVIVRINI